MTRINLGAGREPSPGWVRVDILDLPGIDIVHDLSEFPWPFKDGEAEEIKAVDILEHLPPAKTLDFVKECWRILKPGGKLFIQSPHWKSPNCWIDPSHYRGFDEQSLDYFDPDTSFGANYPYYSDKKFKVESNVTDNLNVEFRMTKI